MKQSEKTENTKLRKNLVLLHNKRKKKSTHLVFSSSILLSYHYFFLESKISTGYQNWQEKHKKLLKQIPSQEIEQI